MGRKKDMIITGGENVYPLEVEHVLDGHPDVSEVVVVGLPDEKWGDVVTAVIVHMPGKELTEAELKAYCQERLARYKTPKRFCLMDKLPKTSVGKLDKKKVVKLYSQAAEVDAIQVEQPKLA